ncbi:MAG: ATP-grasp domain-containing protein [Planctomycetota bacterium]
MHVLFIEPTFPRNQREFVRALKQAGAFVTGIGETPAHALPPDVRRWLDGYEQVRSVVDEGALLDTVRRIQRRGWVDRLEAVIEAHVLPAAHVREAAKIPGTTSRTAWLCRDKPSMKEALRAAGIPCAQSTGASSADEARAFAERVGFPLVLKPKAAAGASGTHKANNREEFEAVIRRTGLDRGAEVAVEEFIEGHEGFYDTICRDGEVVHDFVSHYFPNVLEAMRTRWISPQIVCTNRTAATGYGELRELGRKVHKALGIWSTATHMEWFFGDKGLKFSEIGCRPPGVGVWDLYAAANDIDIFREWAKVVIGDSTADTLSRRYSAGMIALRPDRDGVIAGCDDLDRMRHKYAQYWIDEHVPSPGTPTQPVENGYMANAWIRLRHPDYDELRGILNEIGETVRLRAR